MTRRQWRKHSWENCKKFGFHYIVRTKEDKLIRSSDFNGKIRAIEEGDQDFSKIKLNTNKFETRLVITRKEKAKERWSIFTDLEESSFDEIVKGYEKRFGCEKMFQDEKSSGFEIEKSKIQKYSRFKRLLFCTNVAQALMLFIGDWVHGDLEIRKKYQLHIEMISAFSR